MGQNLFTDNQTYFRNYFFPFSIVEWNKLSREVRNFENIKIFKKIILEFTRPSPNSIFDIYNPYGVKLLTRLRLGFRLLNEHKFKHGFNNTINRISICGGYNIQDIDKTLLSQYESSLTRLLLYDDPKSNSNVNTFILNSANEFILSSASFIGPITPFSNSFFIWLSKFSAIPQ